MRQKWACEYVRTSTELIPEIEFKQRLAEILELLLNKKRQPQNVFSTSPLVSRSKAPVNCAKRAS